MTTLLLTHPECLDHQPPEGHPERAERLRAVSAALSGPRFAGLVRADAPEGSLDSAALCHHDHYIDELRHIAPSTGLMFIDGDTAMSPGTWNAALRGVGGATAAVDAVLGGEVANAFVATRPPGHHAEAARAMGFCFFNQAAIAARYAQRKYGIGRAAVVDFDVHHGNGTQDIFWADQTVMYCSSHQAPLFPGTGARSECGDHDTIVNAPLDAGAGSAGFQEAMNTLLLPRLQRFAPELIVISAGFDAHHRDPLGALDLQTEDFTWVTQQLMEIADRTAGGRVVSVLEGGYDLLGLQQGTAAHVAALMEA
jgi:acetoin utilization deacetylase AcuC-like enzyme